MTNERAIDVLGCHLEDLRKIFKDEESTVNQALLVAISALEQEPCEDAISRDAVIDEINRIGVKAFENYSEYSNLYDFVDKLPSVTQKSGKWIRVTDKTGHLVWECDKCSWQQRFNTNFCPDCGAKMAESEE